MHRTIGIVLLLGFLLASATKARAAETPRGFVDLVHKDAKGKEAKYVLFVPHDYKGDKPYSLILYLHGANESGSDGKKQVEVGLGAAVKKQEKTFPFFVLFPQSQKRTWQADFDDAQRALEMLAAVQKVYKIDAKRVYLTGAAMGGNGTWSLAAKYPDRWAAIVPLCGGGEPKHAARIKHIPCWCFHGSADKEVRVEKSREMVDALRAAGGAPKYDEYPGVPHNCWDRAYAAQELYDWLLMQQLK